jgi:hypothetical protein
MTYGSLPRAPGEEWNAFMGRQSAFERGLGSSGPGLSSGRAAMDAALGRTSTMRSSPSRSGGIGGGGGGGGAPMRFSRPLTPPPELQTMPIPYAETQQRMMEVNPAEKLIAQSQALNVPYQAEFQRLFPQFQSGLLSAGQQAVSLLSGQSPRDITQQIGRNAAQLGYSGFGYAGGRGGLVGNILPRSFGLTSLDMMNRGADLLGRTLGLTQQAMATTMPVSPLQFAVAPSQVFDTLTAQAQYNTEIAHQNALNKWFAQNPGASLG